MSTAFQIESTPETIEIASINRDVQVRVKTDPGTVDDYYRAMLEQEKKPDLPRFPPVIVFRDAKSGALFLSDGNHRLEARAKTGATTIDAMVMDGGKREALAYAVGSSKGHGLRFSNADKRKAVTLALTKLKKMSDNQLAALIGVSQPFVSKLRAELITVIKTEPAEGEATEPSETAPEVTADPITKPLAKFKALLALVPEAERARFAEMILAMLTAPSE